MPTGSRTAAGSRASVARRWRLAVALALAATAVLVAAVGAWGGPDGATAARHRVVPACAKVPTALSRPRALPARFPLPAGAAIGAYGSLRAGELVLTGAIPGDLGSAATFLRTKLAAQGYRVGSGDAEPGEAEAPFARRGLRGKWKLNEIVACPAVKLTLVVLESR